MSAKPGADERRARLYLRARGVGYVPQPPVTEQPGDDWWTRLYGDTTAPKASRRERPKSGAPEDVWTDTKPPDESTPQARQRAAHNPGRRAQAAYADLAPRTRVLLYNSTAAATGWGLGLQHLFSGWITSCQHDTGSIGAAVTLGVGLVVVAGILIDRRTRGWWGPLPWMCRIPVATALLALALYAPASTL